MRLVPGVLTTAEEAALPGVERWLGRIPRAHLAARRRPPYWKVRAGTGVLRLVVPGRPRSPLLLTVRDRRIAAVEPDGLAARALASRLAWVLLGRGLDERVSEAELVANDVGASAAEALPGLLQRAAIWVT